VTPEQVAIKETVRQLLTRSSDTRAAMTSSAGHDEKLWDQLCSLGIAGLADPAGCAATFADTAVVLSELGRFLTPGPFLGAVVAAAAVRATGQDAAGVLSELASGAVTAALVWDTYTLDAKVADVFLVVRDGGLHAVTPADAEVTPHGAMDPTRRLATVRADAPGRFLGELDVARVRDVARAAVAAESAGAAARCLELTVEYTKQRTQFGRPIGSFQALKHRMADLHVLVATAESAALAAATAVDTGVDLPATAATAKVWCTEAFTTAAGEMIQLHGGIAITWEHDAHLYFKRAHGNAQLFGSPRELVSRLSVELG
jgi:alkylation response protein AidB-like acyl-CoA dehydrogenase